MALPHAQLLDVIGIGPLGPALHGAVSTSLIKTERLQLLHLVLPARRNLPRHHVDDECTIHCLEADVEVVKYLLLGGRRDDGLGAAAAWGTARCNDAQGIRTLARRERLRVGSGVPRPEATPRTSSTSMLFSDRNMSQPSASTGEGMSSETHQWSPTRNRTVGKMKSPS